MDWVNGTIPEGWSALAPCSAPAGRLAAAGPAAAAAAGVAQVGQKHRNSKG